MLLINLIVGVLLFLTLYIYLEGRNSEISLVESMIDGRRYLVRNLPDSVAAADNIAKIRLKLNRLVDHLKTSKWRNDQRIKRLTANYRDDVLSEAPRDSKHTSYSINKGEKIYFCLRQRDDRDQLVDLNTVTFVALHELAHVMSESIGHKKEFWDNFRFLLKQAIKLGLYEYQDFRRKPVRYCGTSISDTPLG